MRSLVAAISLWSLVAGTARARVLDERRAPSANALETAMIEEPPPRSARELAAALALALDRLRGEAFEARVTSLVQRATPHLPAALALLDDTGVLGRVLAAASLRPRLLGDVLRSLGPSSPVLGRCTAAILRAGDRAAMEHWILGVADVGALPGLFAEVIDAGQYEAVAGMLARGDGAAGALGALTRARPSYSADAVNADTLESIALRSNWDRFAYDFLIVPGFTPVHATRGLSIAELPVTQQRLELAVADFQQRRLAPYILVTGGSVHPSGTPYNEALMMRDYLVSRGVPPDRILIDPFARHSTTNLRNAGRLMLRAHRSRALIVTGFDGGKFDQAFYFSHPVLSTFASRCRRELGFDVGALSGVDDHHVAFRPAPEVLRLNYRDPLDA